MKHKSVKSNRTAIWLVVGVVVVVAIIYAIASASAGPGKYDEFAQCLGEEGTKFYGAFWCPHCNDQKELFGKSADKLPYIECSTANRQVTAPCIEAGIRAYPTWTFADGTRIEGTLTIDALAARTSCEKP